MVCGVRRLTLQYFAHCVLIETLWPNNCKIVNNNTSMTNKHIEHDNTSVLPSEQQAVVSIESVGAADDDDDDAKPPPPIAYKIEKSTKFRKKKKKSQVLFYKMQMRQRRLLHRAHDDDVHHLIKTRKYWLTIIDFCFVFVLLNYFTHRGEHQCCRNISLNKTKLYMSSYSRVYTFDPVFCSLSLSSSSPPPTPPPPDELISTLLFNIKNEILWTKRYIPMR